MEKMSQSEVLELINEYNSADRKVIKANLKRIYTRYRIRPRDIMNLGYSKCNVSAWNTSCNNNIPMFEQALKISVAFNFDIKEFLQ